MVDVSWVTGRIAVGGAIWTEANMIEVVRAGITHIINMQIEFDDRRLAQPYNLDVLWAPVEDDFQPKPPEVFRRGVDFALSALRAPDSKLLVHCAAGVHRAPMMTLAVLRASGWKLADAKRLLMKRRRVVELVDVYVDSVEAFVSSYKGR